MKKLASFWTEIGDGKVRCSLCPWSCIIPPGKVGFCRGRKNEGGKLYSLVYGSIISAAVDPIEKKPFYHFWPGSGSFSISSPGCNFRCLHCQNWTISQVGAEEVEYQDMTPEEVISLAKNYGCSGISHTYTEPTIWTEFAIDVGKLAHKENLYNTYVTNGYTSIEALEELGPFLDGSNVDVKAFTDRFYQKICGVKGIQPVLDTCKWLVDHKKHLEITYLIIPGENDSSKEIESFCRWVVEELGENIPLHFSRFHPHYKMRDREATPIQTLEMAAEIAKKTGINYVYIGNVPGHELDNTYCPSCGELLIQRYGFTIEKYSLKDTSCPTCGTKIPITGKYIPNRVWL
ncbi:MAG: AmmeMemoRadiSam system radical SAM enzyme [Candidatus Hadarchaeales archaeon]